MTRPLLAVVLGLALSAIAGACSSRVASNPAPACHLFQFRACENPCGRGVQACLASGSWGPCNCVVVDASYASDRATAPDAAPDSDAAAEQDAEPENDAKSDAAADAPTDADAATDHALLD